MRRLWLVLLPFMVTSAFAVSPRLDSLRVGAWATCRVPTSGTNMITAAKTNRWINDGIQQVCANLPALERFDTIVASRGILGYDLNSDFDRLSWVMRMIADTQSFPLSPSTPDQAYINGGGLPGSVDDPANPEDPRWYFTAGNRLMFYPAHNAVAGQADSYLVCYYAIDTNLNADSSQTSVRTKYLQAVQDYVCYRIKEAQGEDYWAKWFLEKLPFIPNRPISKEDEGKK